MRKVVVVIVFTLASLLTALGADAPSLGKIMDFDIHTVEDEVVSLAEAMPAEKYDFIPAGGDFKDGRTFAQQMKHIAAINYSAASAALQEPTPIEVGADENGPVSIKGKDGILKFLKDSYVYAHKAALSLTDTNCREPIKSPFGSGSVPRIWAVSAVVWHSYDHYGQSVIYSRMNGIVPPASQAQK